MQRKNAVIEVKKKYLLFELCNSHPLIVTIALLSIISSKYGSLIGWAFANKKKNAIQFLIDYKKYLKTYLNFVKVFLNERVQYHYY